MKLTIAEELTLPVAAVTEVIGFLGRRGQGKSYAAQRLAELMHEAHAQFVVLDPVGNWWGLRLAADGKAPGIPVPVFGGLHGDVPLEPRAGTMIADVIADRGISVVLDVSQFESDADKARFAHDFGARFYFRRKQAPAAVHLFLEECQEFVPQHPMGEEQRVLHVFQRIAKLGRNYGIGVSLISQRPQEVHKKVLNLTELLFVFQLTGPHERKAVEGWIQEKGIAEDIAAELPKLQRGAPHAWSPAWLAISQVVHITPKWTFDASSTPVVGKAGAVRALAPIDLEKLRIDMAATIERAKADDPRELRKQITDLKRELAKTSSERDRQAASSQVNASLTPQKVVEKYVLKDGQLARAEKLVETINSTMERVNTLRGLLEDYRTSLFEAAEPIAAAIRSTQNTHATMTQRVERPQPRPSPPRDRAVPAATASRPVPRVSLAEGLTETQQRILDTVAMLDTRGITANRVTVARWMGIHPNGGRYGSDIARLREAGYLSEHGFTLTTEGCAAARALPTGEEAAYLALTEEPQRELLRAIVAAHRNGHGPLTRETAAAELGIHPNGGRYGSNIARLREMGLLPERGAFVPSEGLFR